MLVMERGGSGSPPPQADHQIIRIDRTQAGNLIVSGSGWISNAGRGTRACPANNRHDVIAAGDIVKCLGVRLRERIQFRVHISQARAALHSVADHVLIQDRGNSGDGAAPIPTFRRTPEATRRYKPGSRPRGSTRTTKHPARAWHCRWARQGLLARKVSRNRCWRLRLVASGDPSSALLFHAISGI